MIIEVTIIATPCCQRWQALGALQEAVECEQCGLIHAAKHCKIVHQYDVAFSDPPSALTFGGKAKL